MKKINKKTNLFNGKFFDFRYCRLNKGITISDVISNCKNLCALNKFIFLSPGVYSYNFQSISYVIHIGSFVNVKQYLRLLYI